MPRRACNCEKNISRPHSRPHSAAALSVFTAVSFIVSWLGYAHSIAGLTIILGVAVCKATLVGAFFMHLKYDWFKLYFIVFPVVILTVMMVIVLMPDTVLDWHTGHLEPLEQRELLDSGGANAFYVLDLTTRTASPLTTLATASLHVARDGQRVWAFQKSQTNLSVVSLQDLGAAFGPFVRNG